MRWIDKLDRALPDLNYPVLVSFLFVIGTIGVVKELAATPIPPLRVGGFALLLVASVILGVTRLRIPANERERR
jgi:hypothetical protein